MFSEPVSRIKDFFAATNINKRKFSRAADGRTTNRLGFERLEDRMMLTVGFELSGLFASNGGDGSAGFVLEALQVQQNEHTGWAVSALGDINEDGIGDFIVTAPGAGGKGSGPKAQAGEAYLVFGQAGGFPAEFALSSLDGTGGYTILGINRGDSLGGGQGVGPAGDINGDGINDVIIGAHATGEVYVIFGGAGNLASFANSNGDMKLTNLDSTHGFRFQGSGEVGWSTTSAGDINGDGINDLAIGLTNTEYGHVYVVFGRDIDQGDPPFASILDTSDLDGNIGFAMHGVHGVGSNTTDGTGRTISTGGDLNGDGIDDIVIGARFADPGGRTDAGAVYVVYGQNQFPANLDLPSLNGTDGFVINGIDGDQSDPWGDRAGTVVSSDGDLNGDGMYDLVIGAPTADPEGRINAGEVYVIYGRDTSNPFPASFELSSLLPSGGGDGSSGFVINGSRREDRAGNSVTLSGDVNGDGIDDLVVSATAADPNGQINAGQVYVIYGNNTTAFAPALELTELNGHGGFMINGIDIRGYVGGHWGGSRAIAVGDVNGDTMDDVIIGAPFIPITTGEYGEAYVVFGGPSIVPPAQPGISVSPTAGLVTTEEPFVFAENFNYYDAPSWSAGTQLDTGLTVWAYGDVPGWTGGGVNHSHAVDVDTGLTVDYALQLFGGDAAQGPNTLTLDTPIAANDAGTVYPVTFDAGPSVWEIAGQATAAGDGILIEILRGDGSVLASHTHQPGAWPGGPNAQNLSPGGFSYTGDGSGPVTIRISTNPAENERFGGAIDNLRIGGRIDTFSVVLDTKPTADVTIGLSSSDSSEGIASAPSLTFTPTHWSLPQTVTVTGVDDGVVDGDVAFTIITAAAISSDGDYSGLDAADVAVTNIDNDVTPPLPGITIAPTSGLVTTEGGGTDTFSVVLDSAPNNNVTIGISSSNSAEGTVDFSSVTFTPSNWNTAQIVTVTGVDDAIVDGDIAYTVITGAASSSDADYNGLDPSDVSVVNQDDDQTGGGTETYSNNTPVAIPDKSTITSIINVTDDFVITDLNVTLNIDHNRAADLDVFLIAPGGTRIQLFTDVGSNGDDFVDTTLDDEAATAITSGSAPFTGSFRPEGNLAGFDNMSTLGDWTLEVTDDNNKGGQNATGTLLNWSITVETASPLRGRAVSDGATGRNLQLASAHRVAEWAANLRSRIDTDGQDVSYDVQFAELPGNLLGYSRGQTITLDRDAAGLGWFVDMTPWESSEFSTTTGIGGRYDLLTVMAHELGHLYGHDHQHAGVMDATLDVNTRRLPDQVDDHILPLYADFTFTARAPLMDLPMERFTGPTDWASQFHIESALPARLQLALPANEPSYFDTSLQPRIDRESAAVGLLEESNAESEQLDWTDFELTDKLFGEFDKLINEFEFVLR